MKRMISIGVGKKSGRFQKGIIALVFLLALWIFLPSEAGTAFAAEESQVDLTEMFSGVKEQIEEALEKIDTETAEEIFDFIKEKISDGSLKTEEGLKKAIEDGEQQFGVNIDEATAQKVVDTMEKLEEMGFSAEELVDKAKGLYEKYGAEFIDHANEAIAEAVEEAVKDAATGFFENLWEGAKNFFQNLFNGF